jgi:hypothetical protein
MWANIRNLATKSPVFGLLLLVCAVGILSLTMVVVERVVRWYIDPKPVVPTNTVPTNPQPTNVQPTNPIQPTAPQTGTMPGTGKPLPTTPFPPVTVPLIRMPSKIELISVIPSQALTRTEVVIQVRVSGPPGEKTTPTGQVDFQATNSIARTAFLSNGIAEYKFVPTTPGNYSVNVTYRGDNRYQSQSVAIPVDVKEKAKPVSVLASKDKAAFGEKVTFTATVRDLAGGPTPTGQISFYVRHSTNNLPINNLGAQVKLDFTGTALYEPSFASPGKYKIVARYLGPTYRDQPEDSVEVEITPPPATPSKPGNIVGEWNLRYTARWAKKAPDRPYELVAPDPLRVNYNAQMTFHANNTCQLTNGIGVNEYQYTPNDGTLIGKFGKDRIFQGHIFDWSADGRSFKMALIPPAMNNVEPWYRQPSVFEFTRK